MKNIKIFLPLCLIVLFSISCSSDKENPEVVINSLNASKLDLYIEDFTTISVEGTGYTVANLTSTNPNIIIKRINSTVFEVRSSGATTANIYAELKNDTKKQNRNITINFAEHGVKNFTTVEGITKYVDKTDKIVKLLGEPQEKIDSSSGTSMQWLYPQKGLAIIIDKTTNTAMAFNLFSSNYYYISGNNVQTAYATYPYEIGNGWKINNSSTTMDIVVNKLGAPTTKNTSTTTSTNRGYQYSTEKLWFRFYSDSEDNYTGKRIVLVTVY